MNREEVGHLSICCGCMFSGKTSWLLQQFKKYSYIGKKICVINYADDKRYDNVMLSTHDKQMIPCIQTYSLLNVKDVLLQHDVILINEGQFFNDLYDIVNEMVDKYNKIVHIAALDGDFKRGEFGQILKLLPKCDDYIKVHALCAKCKDGTQAPFSFRVSEESQQISIGSDNYIPLCRRCYNHASVQSSSVHLVQEY
jgi:thymidine kinase